MIKKFIFREYDIRGIYNKDLFDNDAYLLGKAIGTKLNELKQQDIVVGYDNRISSIKLEHELVRGLIESGINVTRIGLATTPMVYFARHHLNIKASVVVTASHNPKEYNGFKISYNGINNCYGQEVMALYENIINNNFINGKGIITNTTTKQDYVKYILSSVNINKQELKVIYDCGNGTTSIVADDIFNKLNITATGICNTSDPNFPNHHPDPNIEDNLSMLKDKVLKEKANVGIGYDGDGDRIGVIDELGNFISVEKFMIIIWRDIYNKVTVKKGVYDIKCSKILEDELIKLGIEPIPNKTGTSYLQLKSYHENIPFGGEYSGHTIFRDRFIGFEDAIYSSLRLIEILSNTNLTVSQLLNNINNYYNTDIINFKTTEENKFKIIDNIKEYCLKKNYKIDDLDGVKIMFDYGTVLFRASNTSPNVTYRYEATSKEKLQQLDSEFTKLIEDVNKKIIGE